jgi:RNA polymerase sigma-70 factor (ECF subfamily)
MGLTREEAFERACARWPGVGLGFDAWAAHLDALGWVEDVPAHADSLFLCCACARGDRVACALLEAEFFPYLRRVVARINSAPDVVDEVIQLVRHRLLAGPAPKILRYTGSGHLRSWLRVVTNRLALDELRSKKSARKQARALEGLWVEEPPGGQDGPALREEYASVFERCLRDVLAALSVRDRTVVRMYFLEGLNIDAIGRMYGKDRATAARWVKRCREQMQEDLQQRIQSAFGQVGDSEFASLVRMVKDEIDLSVSVLLASQVQPPSPDLDH